MQLNSTQLNSTQLNSTQLNSLRVDSFAKKFKFYFFNLILACSVSACQVDNKVQGYYGSKPSLKDFANTQIIDSGPTVADGATSLLVAVHLKHSNNSAEPNYQPTYNVTSSLGVNATQCTTSDANGISACILKSTVPGTKTMTLTNAKVGLSKNIIFTSPQGKQKLSIVFAGQVNASTPQGSNVQVTFGQSLKGVRYDTAAGYKVIMSTQGVVQ